MNWQTVDSSVPNGTYWVIGIPPNDQPVKSQLIEGRWFRLDGGSDGLLPFVPLQYAVVS